MDTKFKHHFNKLYEILGKFASFDNSLDGGDKKDKMFRTIPEHFTPIAMVSSKMSFEERITAIQTKMSRLKLAKEAQIGCKGCKAADASGYGYLTSGSGIARKIAAFSLKCEENMCVEAIHHGKWLINRLPSKFCNGQIPIVCWIAGPELISWTYWNPVNMFLLFRINWILGATQNYLNARFMASFYG